MSQSPDSTAFTFQVRPRSCRRRRAHHPGSPSGSGCVAAEEEAPPPVIHDFRHVAQAELHPDAALGPLGHIGGSLRPRRWSGPIVALAVMLVQAVVNGSGAVAIKLSSVSIAPQKVLLSALFKGRVVINGPVGFRDIDVVVLSNSC